MFIFAGSRAGSNSAMSRGYLLMGDIAIQAVNMIARRAGQGRVIPAGSTYKIRGGEFTFKGVRAFLHILQAGPSFFIEKSKTQNDC